jgi:hypothetical protein
MKKSQLRQIIKEEISKVLKETTEDEIASRVRKLGKEAGIADAAIEDYISDLSGHFEPDAYEGDTDEDLLKDLKLYIKNMLNENESPQLTDQEKNYLNGGIEDFLRDTVFNTDILANDSEEFNPTKEERVIQYIIDDLKERISYY